MSPITINGLVKEAHKVSKEKGFWDEKDPRDPIWQFILTALIANEAHEGCECVRRGEPLHWIDDSKDGKPSGLESELADVVIRVADLCGAMGIDMAAAIDEKLEFNRTRPHKHGGKLF